MNNSDYHFLLLANTSAVEEVSLHTSDVKNQDKKTVIIISSVEELKQYEKKIQKDGEDI